MEPMKQLNREQIIKALGDLAIPLPAEKTKIRKIREYDKTTKSFKDRELTYIPIYVTIEELNDKFGPHWSVENLAFTTKDIAYSYTEDILDDKGNLIWIKIKGKNLPKKVRKQALETAAFCTLDLVLRDAEGKEICRRPGTGSGTNSGQRILDSDKMTKTALANAIRKAYNNMGGGIYLWHADDESIPEPEEDHDGTKDETNSDMSNENKTKLDKLREEYGLGKDNLTEYLLKCFPKSKGKYDFLKIGDTDGTQNEKIEKFISFVVDDIKKLDETKS